MSSTSTSYHMTLERSIMDQSKLYKRRAWSAVARALKSGKLTKPDCCNACGCKSDSIQAHHDSYDKPLEVTWLCLKCHRSLHGDNRALNDEQIKMIRQSDKSTYALSKELGVSFNTVTKVKERQHPYE